MDTKEIEELTFKATMPKKPEPKLRLIHNLNCGCRLNRQKEEYTKRCNQHK